LVASFRDDIDTHKADGPGVSNTDQVGCPAKQDENVGAPTFKVLL
jgi:hypothetical protein